MSKHSLVVNGQEKVLNDSILNEDREEIIGSLTLHVEDEKIGRTVSVLEDALNASRGVRVEACRESIQEHPENVADVPVLGHVVAPLPWYFDFDVNSGLAGRRVNEN